MLWVLLRIGWLLDIPRFLLGKRSVEKTSVVCRNKGSGSVELKCAFRGSLIGVLTNIAPYFPVVPEMFIPIINGANRWLGLQHLVRNPLVILLDGLIHLFLLYREVTLAGRSWIVPRVSMFLYLVPGTCHYVCYSVDKSLVLSLHIVSLEIWLVVVVLGSGPGCWTPPGFDHGFYLFEISVVPGFVLEVQEFLCFFYVH